MIRSEIKHYIGERLFNLRANAFVACIIMRYLSAWAENHSEVMPAPKPHGTSLFEEKAKKSENDRANGGKY